MYILYKRNACHACMHLHLINVKDYNLKNTSHSNTHSNIRYYVMTGSDYSTGYLSTTTKHGTPQNIMQ